MTALASTNVANGRTTVVVPQQTESPLANILNAERFEQLQRVATLMAHSSLTPKHLRGGTFQETQGNCFRVVNQAIRWGFDPFAVADESYVVGGKLGYQGKLVAAVINSRGGIKENLKVEFKGAVGTDARTAIVTGHFKSEATPRTIELSVGQAKTANDMWKKDPDQKLFYSATIKWARRHCPEIVMGVLTDEELEAMRSGASFTGEPKEPLALPLGRSSTRKKRETVKEDKPAETEVVDAEATSAETESNPGVDSRPEGPTDEQQICANEFLEEIRDAGDRDLLMEISGRLGKSKELLGPLYRSVADAYSAAIAAMK